MYFDNVTIYSILWLMWNCQVPFSKRRIIDDIQWRDSKRFVHHCAKKSSPSLVRCLVVIKTKRYVRVHDRAVIQSHRNSNFLCDMQESVVGNSTLLVVESPRAKERERTNDGSVNFPRNFLLRIACHQQPTTVTTTRTTNTKQGLHWRDHHHHRHWRRGVVRSHRTTTVALVYFYSTIESFVRLGHDKKRRRTNHSITSPYSHTPPQSKIVIFSHKFVCDDRWRSKNFLFDFLFYSQSSVSFGLMTTFLGSAPLFWERISGGFWTRQLLQRNWTFSHSKAFRHNMNTSHIHFLLSPFLSLSLWISSPRKVVQSESILPVTTSNDGRMLQEFTLHGIGKTKENKPEKCLLSWAGDELLLNVVFIVIVDCKL